MTDHDSTAADKDGDWLAGLDAEAETKHGVIPQGDTPWQRFVNSGTYRKAAAGGFSLMAVEQRSSLSLMTNEEFIDMIRGGQ